MAEHKVPDYIAEILRLYKLVIRAPCCCSLCDRRIKVYKELNSRIVRKYSFFKAKWSGDIRGTIIVPDDPGCFVTRVIEGFGTILSCIGINDRVFNASVYNNKYESIGTIIVKLRITKNMSYYYTEKILEENKHIVIPSKSMPLVNETDIVGDTYFRDIFAQAIGLYTAMRYGYELLTIYRSIITPGNELRDSLSRESIIIGSKKFYERVLESLENENIELAHVPIDNNRISVSKLEEIIRLLGQKRQV